jgi:hypothetical protein
MAMNLVISFGYASDNLLRSLKTKDPYMNAVAIRNLIDIHDYIHDNDFFLHCQLVSSVKPPSSSCYSSMSMKTWANDVISSAGFQVSSVTCYESLSTGEVLFRIEFYHLSGYDVHEKIRDLYRSVTVYNGGSI